MRHLLPLLIAVGAAFVAGADGNVARGLVAGLVIGAMAWGAFAWKPGAGAQTNDIADHSARKEASASRDGLPAIREVGTILAMSISESLTQLGASEVQAVSDAGIDLDIYKQELIHLHSASAFVAAGELILDADTAAEVRAGFTDFWNSAANSSPKVAYLHAEFHHKLATYAQAIDADRSPRNPNQLHFSQVSQAFANFLGAAAGRSEANPNEVVISMMGLPQGHWDGMRLGAKQLFERAKVPMRPD